MYVDVTNENYGYAVATHGDYVGVGSPSLMHYSALTSSKYWTGSVDVFHYDINTDTHTLIETLHHPLNPTEDILLAAEDANILHTEVLSYDFINQDKDIAVNLENFLVWLETDYGHALDFFEDKLAVGSRYYWGQVTLGGTVFDSSGSCVDIWDYTYADKHELVPTDPPVVLGYGLMTAGHSTGSLGYTGTPNFRGFDSASNNLYWINLNAPAGYDEVWLYGTYTASISPYLASKVSVPPEGGIVTYYHTASLTPFTASQVVGHITNDPLYLHIPNPEPDLTGSFGHAVSLNTEWLAVGSPHSGSDTGKVYLYRNQSTGSTLSWSLQQTLESPSGSLGEMFGWSLSLNKCFECSVPNRLVVGVGSETDQAAYVFEYSNSAWIGRHYFQPQMFPTAPLTFDEKAFPIINSGSYFSASFGYSVSTYGDTVVIGAPTDRRIYEYTGSSQYEQGAIYVFEKCGASTNSDGYELVQKYYGNLYSLKNNRLGWSVSVYGNNLIAGAPKKNIETLTSCFVEGSIFQQNYCEADLENTLNGQWVYFIRNTSSLDWEFSNIFQKKKKFMNPYRSMGASVSVGDKSIVIGSPMMLMDSNRYVNVNSTSSNNTELGDVAGKAYIYNLHNYKERFYVGNVFYRNGKIVVNTSGSAFEGLYFNPTTPYSYEYLLNYQSRHTLYEKNILCSVDPGEFNVSTNPTAVVKATSSFDTNGNGIYDFQDVDVLLRYMQYKNTVSTGSVTFDWSSSVLQSDDEKSYYAYNASLWTDTDSHFSSSFTRFETTDTWMASLLDFNQDNKIDINDMRIMWKYASNRLTQQNYSTYINTNSQRQNYADVITHLDNLSKRNALPMINEGFTTYYEQYAADKTGSFLSPFVTTIGLYSGLELVAVAKLGSPIKLPRDLPINFVVKIDF